MGNLIICRPRYAEVKQPVVHCETCGLRRRMLYVFERWYGGKFTCLTCGEKYSVDEGRMERPFARGWRQRSVERAKRIWREHGRKDMDMEAI